MKSEHPARFQRSTCRVLNSIEASERLAPKMIATESDPRFAISDSSIPGAGKGLFARIPLAAGERLRVIGLLIAANSVSDECTRYADAYKVRVGDHLLIPVGYGGLVNHSATAPNMEKVVEDREVYLQTLRPIDAGEELLFCYSEYAQARFPLRR